MNTPDIDTDGVYVLSGTFYGYDENLAPVWGGEGIEDWTDHPRMHGPGLDDSAWVYYDTDMNPLPRPKRVSEIEGVHFDHHRDDSGDD